jgi:Zn-dependent protease with chaperone function
MSSVPASYYDGLSTRKHAVMLSITQGLLEIRGDDILRVIPLCDVNISAKLGNTPRLLHFTDGAHCEVKQHAEFEASLKNAGIKPQSIVSRLENTWHYAVAAACLCIAFIIATFYWGLPWFADITAARIPPSITLAIDNHFLSIVDEGMMQPSTLSTEKQNALKQRFEKLKVAYETPPHELKFRSSKTVGANAFALPGGTIVATDQLVALAKNDEEIIAVLAHELGHVSERHPMRQLLQSSVVGLAMTWYLGDISTLLAAAPTLLLETSYSRNFERRADRYAADMLSLNNISPSRLADILEKLEASHTGKHDTVQNKSTLADLFSTHPDTAERLQNLRSNSLPN